MNIKIAWNELWTGELSKEIIRLQEQSDYWKDSFDLQLQRANEAARLHNEAQEARRQSSNALNDKILEDKKRYLQTLGFGILFWAMVGFAASFIMLAMEGIINH